MLELKKKKREENVRPVNNVLAAHCLRRIN
jgi:hypothetical protein